MEGADEQGNGGTEKRAGVFIGPEFGTVSRPDLVSATREAGDAGFDVLIGFAFNYDAHSSDFSKLGRIPVLKARINADMHMAEDLKNTGKGNLFGSPTNEAVWDSLQKRSLKGAKGKFIFNQLKNTIPSSAFTDEKILNSSIGNQVALDLKLKIEQLL